MSYHDIDPDETPEDRMVAEIAALSPSLGEWAAGEVSGGASCGDLVAKLRSAAEKAARGRDARDRRKMEGNTNG